MSQQERPKEYNLGYNIGKLKQEGKLNESQEYTLISKAMSIIYTEGLSWSVFINGKTDGLKGK